MSLIPAHTGSPYSLALIDSNGALLDSIIEIEDTQRAPATGLFLLTPAGNALGATLYAGVGIHDTGTGGSSYEIAQKIIDAPAVVAEQEENDSAADAQIVDLYPAQVNGTIDGPDTGAVTHGTPAEDFEDCYSLHTSDTHLGVRLDSDPGLDLDLLVLDTSGDPLPYQPMTSSTGQAEVFFFEPRTEQTRHVVCVGVLDAAVVNTGDYQLTVVDLMR